MITSGKKGRLQRCKSSLVDHPTRKMYWFSRALHHGRRIPSEQVQSASNPFYYHTIIRTLEIFIQRTWTIWFETLLQCSHAESMTMCTRVVRWFAPSALLGPPDSDDGEKSSADANRRIPRSTSKDSDWSGRISAIISGS